MKLLYGVAAIALVAAAPAVAQDAPTTGDAPPPEAQPVVQTPTA